MKEYQENFENQKKKSFDYAFGKEMGNKKRRTTMIILSLATMYGSFNEFNLVIVVISLIILIYNLKNEFYEEGLKEGFYSGYEIGHTDGTLEETELNK